MTDFLWGSLGRDFVKDHAGETLNPGVNLRKPQYVDIEPDIGERLKEAGGEALEQIRQKALQRNVPEHKVAPGFETNLMLFTGSTESRDRYGDRILVDGWKLDEFRLNPVFLAFHDYDLPSIGQCIDVYTDVVATDGKIYAGDALVRAPKDGKRRLRFLMLWATDENPKAKILHNLYKGKDMRATSVGFIPEEVHVPGSDDERSQLDLGPFGVLHKLQNLLELSAVSVPALPEAIQEEAFQAYREGLDEQEQRGLAMLAEQMNSLDHELAVGIRSYLPLKKKTVDLFKKRTSLAPGTLETEDDGAGDDATHGGDKLDDLDALMADLVPKDSTDGNDDTKSNGTSKSETRLIPEDISTEMAPPEEPWEDLTEESFEFEALDEEQRAQVAGFYAYSSEIPPSSFDQLKLGHHRREDGYVSLQGTQLSMEELLTGAGEGADVPAEERRGAYDHLAAHLEAFEVDIPEFTEEPTGGAEEAGMGSGGPKKPKPKKDVEIVDAGSQSGASAGDLVKNVLATASRSLVGELISEIKSQTGIEVDFEERKSGERKWRAVRGHKPETAPLEQKFSRPDFEKSVGEDLKMRRDASLFYDANDLQNPKSYLYPHHEAKDGIPVVFDGVKKSMRTLLGRSVDGSIPEDTRKRGYTHLRGHYEQFEREAPAFRSLYQLSMLGEFLRETAESLVNADEDVRASVELTLDMVYMGFMAASDKAFEIQALTFRKESWEKDDVESWLKERGYAVDRITETGSTIVAEQRSKSEFSAVSERIHDGESDAHVFAIGGRLRSEVGQLRELVGTLETRLESGLAEVKQAVERSGGTITAFNQSKKNGKGDDVFRKIYEQSNDQLEQLDEKMKELV